MMMIDNIELDLVLDMVTSSEGSLPLAAERLTARLKKSGIDGNITEYDIQAKLGKLDNESAEGLSGRFRTLALVKLFEIWSLMTDHVKLSIGDLKPAELVKAHGALTNSLVNMTNNATKITFDLGKEIEELKKEFPDLDVDSVKEGIKEFQIKAVK